MGNSNSINSQEQRDQRYIAMFEEIRIEYSSEFGEVQILQHRQNATDKIMIKEKYFNDQSSLQQFMKSLNIRRRLRNEQNASVVASLSNKIISLDNRSEEWCSTHLKLTLAFEFHERTLEKILRHRANKKEEKQLV